MINWHEVASHAPIQRLAEIIRRQFNIWSGFIDPSGEAVSAGGAQPVDKALCVAMMGREDATGSCQRSVRQWADQLAEDAKRMAAEGPQLVGCHAGLGALVVPIVWRGRVVGGCYASGFLMEGGDSEVQQRGRALDLNALFLRQSCKQLPKLEGRELNMVSELCQAMADEALRLLTSHTLEKAEGVERGKTLEDVGDLVSTRLYSEMVGESAAMKRLYGLIGKVSRSSATVLVTGEAGTGKELVARAIHWGSERRGGAFIAQNCAAMNDNLLDSELFGHKKGAFTGSISDKPGLFGLADGGTFFLDEVGDMSSILQVKLLRVLEEGTFQAVGDTVTRRVDVRVIAATHRDLQKLIETGHFRQDLYFRLNVISIHIPALRERAEDIPALVERFLIQHGREHSREGKQISARTLERLMAYQWPGNVRELQNEIERMVVLSGDDVLIPDDLLSARIAGASAEGAERAIGVERAAHVESVESAERAAPTEIGEQIDITKLPNKMPAAVEVLERRMMLEALRATGWNKSEASRRLGVSRRNLIRKVERFQLEVLRAPHERGDDADEAQDDDDEDA